MRRKKISEIIAERQRLEQTQQELNAALCAVNEMAGSCCLEREKRDYAKLGLILAPIAILAIGVIVHVCKKGK